MSEKILTDIKLTDNAKNRIDELKDDNKDVFIRIMITSGGCAGKQYYILMDDYIGETDHILKVHNEKYNEELVYIVIDEVSLEVLHNSTIDFSDDLEFSGFKIDNPNVKATCQCGNSFNCSGDCVVKKDGCNN
jgi:iron-sulfur cluster assembly accessory protein